RRRLLTVLTVLAVVVLSTCSSPVNFALRGQGNVRSLRKRDGLELHTKASHKNSVLSREGRDVLESIQLARGAGDWIKVKSLYASYAGTGTEIQIFNAVLHTAVECVQYKEGADIFDSLYKLDITKTSATYSAALKIFAKLGHNATVKELWEEARNNPACDMNEPLTAARIDAAAEEGDVESALLVLSNMTQTNVSINIAHVTNAIRACWAAGGVKYRTAEHLFNLTATLGLEPNIVTFSCLVGAYGVAPLEKALAAYADMRSMGIEPNPPFADAYLGAILQKPRAHSWQPAEIMDALQLLQEEAPNRIEAAKLALSEFKGLGLELTDLARRIEHFESQLLPGLRAADPQPLVVPYCTVGYRSGVYAKELMDKHGLQNVRNGEGVIMWTFDGSGLVRPASGAVGTVDSAQVVGKAAGDAGETPTSAWQPVTRVHVYGKPWDMAAEGYTTEFFSQTGGAWRFLKQKCSKSGIKAVPWLFIFVLFYLFFTPACGVMYNCGCRLFPAKYGQASLKELFSASRGVLYSFSGFFGV
ncbi:PPR4, partial [Symbiodinium sp. CCMP2456]